MKNLNENADHVVDIYLQLAPPTTAREWDRFLLEMYAMTPAVGRSVWRWRFIAGTFSVSCDANHEAASALRLRLSKRRRSYRTTGNELPRAANLKQYTPVQYAAALKRTPELES